MTPENTKIQPRVDALDALRGLAILAMVLSSTVRYKILPTWMYHAQVPPPDHIFNKTLPGLTWVDLVFPTFLFAMGAAIPLALTRRLAQGWSMPKIVLQIFKRGAFLGAFAIILQHLRPNAIAAGMGNSVDANPNPTTWLLAIAGFVLLALMFGRLPIAWNLNRYQFLISLVGWIACFFLLSKIDYGEKGFSLNFSDPILISLANMAVFGSLIWLLTRSNWMLRLGFLVILLALQFASGSQGWVQILWKFSLAPWIFQFYYLKYLFIVIPGTIAGDLILQQSRKEVILLADEPEQITWSRSQLTLILGSMLLLCVVLLVGLQARWTLETTLISAVIVIATQFLFTKSEHHADQTIKQFYQWGVYWLALGLCFEPFQTGIKKDPSTYSYYFVTTAIAFFLLIVLTILIDRFSHKRYLKLLIENGQNPMIAYVAFANLLWPILQLSGLEDWIIAHTETPILGVLKGVAYTLAIALFTQFCTRQKFFWKT
ncbi:MAG TPA: DUF5009 domain-containing protein [Coleofasciculaceae cyanobacterium]